MELFKIGAGQPSVCVVKDGWRNCMSRQKDMKTCQIIQEANVRFHNMESHWLGISGGCGSSPLSLSPWGCNSSLSTPRQSFIDLHYSQDSSQLFHMVPGAETCSFTKLKAYRRYGLLGVILDYFLKFFGSFIFLKVSTSGLLPMCVFVVFLCITICVCMSMCCVYLNSCSFCSWCHNMSLRLLLFGKDCTRKVLEGSLGNVA